MLLKEDGLTAGWSGVDGEFDHKESSETVQFALQQSSNHSLKRVCGTPGMGCSDFTREDKGILLPVALVNDHVLGDVSINVINNVHQLACGSFRKKLIDHFDTLFK